MVDVIGRAKVVIEGDVDSSSIDRAGSRIGSALKTGALVGAAALGTVAVAGYKSVLAFEEAESVSRKLSNVLGNMDKTGAVEAVDNLASSLQRMTGIDDEVIKGGETVLATFSEVAKSAGEQGGMFERATRAAVDLASTPLFNGNVSGAATQLGKALQDPERGVTALGRAGVTFTPTQREMIKNFVETGDVASAQNIVLKEVEKQVGGTAEKSAKGSDKIARGLDEVKESLGKLIVKLLGGKEGSDGLSDALFDLSESMSDLADSDAWKDLGTGLRKIGNLLEWVADTAERMKKDFEGIADLSWSDLLPGGAAPIQFKNYGTDSGDLLSLLGGKPRAAGGPASGLTLVGEQGPELVSLPAGSYVHNNNDTQEMLSGGGVHFHITTPATSDLLSELNWLGKFGSFGAVSVGA